MAYTNLSNQVRVGVRAGAIVPTTPPLITTNLVMNLDAQYYTSGTWTGTSSTSLNQKELQSPVVTRWACKDRNKCFIHTPPPLS